MMAITVLGIMVLTVPVFTDIMEAITGTEFTATVDPDTTVWEPTELRVDGMGRSMEGVGTVGADSRMAAAGTEATEATAGTVGDLFERPEPLQGSLRISISFSSSRIG